MLANAKTTFLLPLITRLGYTHIDDNKDGYRLKKQIELPR